ncbi:hypothetical protein Tco_1581449, partial [Tanacetum coccineum]
MGEDPIRAQRGGLQAREEGTSLVIFLINQVPESYVPAWFETDMYLVTYHNYVKPVP